jgi:hypothetical protein
MGCQCAGRPAAAELIRAREPPTIAAQGGLGVVVRASPREAGSGQRPGPPEGPARQGRRHFLQPVRVAAAAPVIVWSLLASARRAPSQRRSEESPPPDPATAPTTPTTAARPSGRAAPPPEGDSTGVEGERVRSGSTTGLLAGSRDLRAGSAASGGSVGAAHRPVRAAAPRRRQRRCCWRRPRRRPHLVSVAGWTSCRAAVMCRCASTIACACWPSPPWGRMRSASARALCR